MSFSRRFSLALWSCRSWAVQPRPRFKPRFSRYLASSSLDFWDCRPSWRGCGPLPGPSHAGWGPGNPRPPARIKRVGPQISVHKEAGAIYKIPGAIYKNPGPGVYKIPLELGPWSRVGPVGWKGFQLRKGGFGRNRGSAENRNNRWKVGSLGPESEP